MFVFHVGLEGTLLLALVGAVLAPVPGDLFAVAVFEGVVPLQIRALSGLI